MDNFVRNLITEWRGLGLPESGEVFVTAVSGGADSVSLLLALQELRERGKLDIRLVAAHFDHKLRGRESEEDAEFVKRLAGELGVELATGSAELKKEGNLEQNARNARYEFLAETAERLKAYAVLTGHTLNDQAETFLMNLVRGAGPEGLRGMPEFRPMSPGKDRPLLVRPLLSWAKRADTENYCRLRKIEYRYDTMNEDLAFTRVRIRKLLIPMLEDFNPKIIETLARTAGLMPAAAAEKAEPPKTELKLSELKALSKQELYATVRSWLAGHRGDTRQLQLKHIEAVGRLVHSRKSGRTVELPDGEIVEKSGGMLVFKKLKVEKTPSEN